jgi:hypothetical protein
MVVFAGSSYPRHRRAWHRIDLTRLLLILLLPGLFGCSKEPDDANSIAECKAKFFAGLNAKSPQQCIDACIKCENGVTTTCATSCSLKGTR